MLYLFDCNEAGDWIEKTRTTNVYYAQQLVARHGWSVIAW